MTSSMDKNTTLKDNFVIIAGQPKAGTTSLFDWLAQHPEVNPSTTKEARFFIDQDYPLRSSFRFNGKNVDSYLKNFKSTGAQIFLEATPDYLYNNAALEIEHLLPNAKIVVIVRDPIERIVSAYYFYKQRGFISGSWSLDEYVDEMAGLDIVKDTPIPMRVLEQCKAHYLERFQQEFGNKLLTIYFKDLRNNPRSVYEQVCCHIGLEPLDHVEFSASNATVSGGFTFFSKYFYTLKSKLVYFFLKSNMQWIIPFFSPFNKLIEKRFSKGTVEKELPSDQTLDTISKYLHIQSIVDHSE